jgi:hypothetical protein
VPRSVCSWCVLCSRVSRKILCASSTNRRSRLCNRSRQSTKQTERASQQVQYGTGVRAQQNVQCKRYLNVLLCASCTNRQSLASTNNPVHRRCSYCCSTHIAQRVSPRVQCSRQLCIGTCVICTSRPPGPLSCSLQLGKPWKNGGDVTICQGACSRQMSSGCLTLSPMRVILQWQLRVPSWCDFRSVMFSPVVSMCTWRTQWLSPRNSWHSALASNAFPSLKSCLAC